jgi:hypothetical protein
VPLHWHGHARRKDNAAVVAPDALAGQHGWRAGPGPGNTGAARSRVTWGFNVTPIRAGDICRLPGLYLRSGSRQTAVAGLVYLLLLVVAVTLGRGAAALFFGHR